MSGVKRRRAISDKGPRDTGVVALLVRGLHFE